MGQVAYASSLLRSIVGIVGQVNVLDTPTLFFLKVIHIGLIISFNNFVSDNGFTLNLAVDKLSLFQTFLNLLAKVCYRSLILAKFGFQSFPSETVFFHNFGNRRVYFLFTHSNLKSGNLLGSQTFVNKSIQHGLSHFFQGLLLLTLERILLPGSDQCVCPFIEFTQGDDVVIHVSDNTVYELRSCTKRGQKTSQQQ